jgi:hypothetical protein
VRCWTSPSCDSPIASARCSSAAASADDAGGKTSSLPRPTTASPWRAVSLIQITLLAILDVDDDVGAAQGDGEPLQRAAQRL